MDDTTLKIAIAAFFHDMGKFAGKDVFNLDPARKVSPAPTFRGGTLR